MEVSKECMICGNELATRRCNKCGSLVCEKDYDARSGLCSDCHSFLHKSAG